MRKLVFVGNCQASALRAVYNNLIAQTPEDHAKMFDIRHLTPEQEDQISQADLVCAQVTDLESRFRPNIVRGELIWFPYVSGIFLWPFGGSGAHVRGVVPPERGDDYLNKMIRDNIPLEEAATRYLDYDIASDRRVGRRFDLCLGMQELRDEKSGVEVASFILSRLRGERLFITPGHLSNSIFAHVAAQVFRNMSIDAPSISSYIPRMDWFPTQEIPIHPSIVSALGLSYGGRDWTYQTDFGPMIFEEWVAAYLTAKKAV